MIVQLGALPTAGLAHKTWNDTARLEPDLSVGKLKRIEAVQRDGMIVYRALMVGFYDRAEAAAFCEAVRAYGKPCLVKQANAQDRTQDVTVATSSLQNGRE